MTEQNNPIGLIEATEKFMVVSGQSEQEYTEELDAERLDMLSEEIREYWNAVAEDDEVEELDALLDIIVVAYGNAVAKFGLEMTRAAAAEVARSNDDKINGKHGPIVWKGEPLVSKIGKPEGWVGPRIAEILEGKDLT
ncbi:gp040 [Rhodococcus phage ReqiDocB7]|uniref:MazG-like pyrophosphatase n=1 Tax=Rhodococcus phage ReqiDocB7 TaxID=691966 RepID=UPI0001CDD76A|nr:MazG-like pyrophosphatase [Rhodococcus phage ReqiDocB7]ADD80826.1 gp040 [Rhodococcus phage ReqiDocB7]